MLAMPLAGSLVWEPPQRLGPTNRNAQNPLVVGEAPGAWLFWQEGRGEGLSNRRLLRFTRLESPPENLGNSLTLLDLATERNLMASAIPLGKGEVAVACADGDGQVLVMRGFPSLNQWEAPRRITRSAGSCFQPTLLYQAGAGILHVFTVEESGGAWRMLHVTLADQSTVVGGPFVLADSRLTGEMPFAPRAIEAGNQVWVFYQARPRWQKDRAPRESIRRLVLDGRSMSPLEDSRLGSSEERGMMPLPVVWRDQVRLFWRRHEGRHWTIAQQSWKIRSQSAIPRAGESERNFSLFQGDRVEILPSSLADPILTGIDLWGGRLYLCATGSRQGRYLFSLRTLDFSSGRWSSEQLEESPAQILGNRVVEGPSGRMLLQDLDTKPRNLQCLREDTRVDPPRFTRTPDPDAWQEDHNLFVAWRAPADPTGIEGYGFVVSPTPTSVAPLATLSEFQTRLEIGPWLAEGTNYFNLAAWDRAGNVSEVVSTRILVDSLPPTLVSLWSLSHAESHWSSNARVILRVHGETRRSQPLEYGWAVFPAMPGTEEALEKIARSATLTSSLFTVLCPHAGTNVIAVSVRDARGRWSQPGFHEVWLDASVSLADSP